MKSKTKIVLDARERRIGKFAKSHVDEIIEFLQDDDNQGFCIACGEAAYCIEPDARERACEFCERRTTVYGAQELLFYCTGI